jgi:hypothetical protein
MIMSDTMQYFTPSTQSLPSRFYRQRSCFHPMTLNKRNSMHEASKYTFPTQVKQASPQTSPEGCVLYHVRRNKSQAKSFAISNHFMPMFTSWSGDPA